MPRLYVISGDELGRTVDVDGAVVLGRGKGSDVLLHGASISRSHARLEPGDDGWWVVDLGSSNGTRVDGERVERAPLSDGQVFLLGDVELRFRLEVPEEATEKPPPAAPVDAARLEFDVPPGAVGAGAPAAEGGLELEGEWSAVAPDEVAPARSGPPPSAARPARAAAPAGRRAAETAARRAAALGGPVGGAQRTAGGGRVLQYHRVENTGGLFGAELGQQPPLVRWLLYLAVVALFAGLAWGAFHLTATMKRNQAAVEGTAE